MTHQKLLLTAACFSIVTLTACNSSDSGDSDNFKRNLQMNLSDSTTQALLDDTLATNAGTTTSLSIAQGDLSADEISIRSLNNSSQVLARKMARTAFNQNDKSACDSGSVSVSISGDIADDETSGNVTAALVASNCRSYESSDGINIEGMINGSLSDSVSWQTSGSQFTALSSTSTGNLEITYVGDGSSDGHNYSFGFLYDLSDLNNSMSLNTVNNTLEVDANYSVYIEVYYETDNDKERVGGSMKVATLDSVIYDAPTTTSSLSHPVDGRIQVTAGGQTATVDFDQTDYTVTIGNVSNTYDYEDDTVF
ncbi:hypothetical protein [Gynuella sunshinyii]|uniref:Lipoprotein n=1 Tax=Gynuella sunshinyii YC6258 TaxID=1445510 RepID=A0A0C5VGX1_9GAMM|nr:hypothetical protein [Gynuella sunshinyii]AJQ92608.1 hypothetical Protein YC6258_00558 [Gynuella sunshinyii YC6258]